MRFSVSIFIGLLLTSACSKLGDFQPDTVGVASPSPQPSPSVTVTAPVAIHAWNFEDSGSDIGSVGGWDGAINSTAYTSTPGEVRVGAYALKFPNVSNSFALGAQTLPPQFTVACWVRWIAGGGTNTVIANSAAGNMADGFRIYVAANGQVNLETGDGAIGVPTSSVTHLTTATYTHVAVTLSTVTNQSAIYINGVQDQTGTVEPNLNLTTAAFIGSMAAGTNSFSGELDDCRIFDVALSSTEMALFYGSY